MTRHGLNPPPQHVPCLGDPSGAYPQNRQITYIYTFANDGKPLGVDWMTLRQPFGDDVFDRKSRPGWLRIRGQKSLPALRDQSLLLRRQEAFVIECETMLEFDPECFNHWAGMSYRYSENNQHYVYVSYDEESACRVLLKVTTSASVVRISPIGERPPISGTSVIRKSRRTDIKHPHPAIGRDRTDAGAFLL